MTLTDEVSEPQSARGTGKRRSRVRPAGLLLAAALGALVTLVTIWSLGPPSSTVERPSSLQAGFGSHTMKIVDQLGTVDVDVWVKNESSERQSAACAVIVTSGTGQRHHMYRGSAAFTRDSIKPHESKHLAEVVTGVYYDGDATGPIGSMLLPLPQYAKLGHGSLVDCTQVRAS
jgi:hypothetical protein